MSKQQEDIILNLLNYCECCNNSWEWTHGYKECVKQLMSEFSKINADSSQKEKNIKRKKRNAFWRSEM